MKLYKYVSSDRIDILINGKIRFTQPAVWNDPFELVPFYIDDSQNGLLRREKIYQSMIDSLMHNNHKHFIKSDINNCINNNIVALSLTEDKENLLMWAHYAEEHKGFIIELDTNDAFFKSEGKLLFKMSNNSIRPNVCKEDYKKFIYELTDSLKNNKISDIDVKKVSYYLTKSSEWDYEKEWRLISSIYKADNFAKIKQNRNVIHLRGDFGVNEEIVSNYSIALFNLPSSCIKSIYCGKKMKRSLVRQLYFMTKYNEQFSHIKILSSDIDDETFGLNYSELHELDILSNHEYLFEHDSNITRFKYLLDIHIWKYKREKLKYLKLKY